VFEELQLGKIKRIDILERRNKKGQKYNRVFIHFHKWYNGEARTRIISGKDIKIVYDTPWFWKVSASKWIEKENKTKPHIYIEEEEEHDINPRQIIRELDDDNNDDSYVPDYGNISPPKCRTLIKKNK